MSTNDVVRGQYLAALDVHRAKVFGRCERKSGIAPFDRLVMQVMAQSPYNEARRVFWIVDNGFLTSGRKVGHTTEGKTSEFGTCSWASSRQLAESDRNLFFDPAKEGPDPQ